MKVLRLIITFSFFFFTKIPRQHSIIDALTFIQDR